MNTFLLALILSTQLSLNVEGLPINPQYQAWPPVNPQYKAWPNSWQTSAKSTADASWLWDHFYAAQQNSTGNQPPFQGKVSQCDIPAKPNPYDLVKSPILDALITPTLVTRFGTEMNQQTFRVAFPSDYGQGIGISSGPPPKNVYDDKHNMIWTTYNEDNLNQWNKRFQINGNDQLTQADKELKTTLEADLKAGKISKFMQVAGLYEQCSEISYIVSVVGDAITYGEQLRKDFGQDSFLIFWERQTITDKLNCGSADSKPVSDTTGNYFRPFGLGFGAYGPPEQDSREHVIPLGNLCEWKAPVEAKEFPLACSVHGQTMWADTNAPYPQYDPAKKC